LRIEGNEKVMVAGDAALKNALQDGAHNATQRV
jgi:hypothetical protein